MANNNKKNNATTPQTEEVVLAKYEEMLNQVLESRTRNGQNTNRRRKPLAVGNVIKVADYEIEKYTDKDGKTYHYFVFGEKNGLRISEKHLLTIGNGLGIDGETYEASLRNLLAKIEGGMTHIKITAVNFIETAFGKQVYYSFETIVAE